MKPFDKFQLMDLAVQAVENILNKLPEWRQKEYTGHEDEPPHSSMDGLACEALDVWFDENVKNPTLKNLEDIVQEII